MSATKKSGWWNPEPLSFKKRATFHYVSTGGRTLCNRWLYIGLGTIEEGDDEHKENCKVCVNRKLALGKKNKDTVAVEAAVLQEATT